MKKGFCALALLVATQGALAQTVEDKSQGPAGGTVVADKGQDVGRGDGVDFTESAAVKAKTNPSGQSTADAKITETAKSPWSGTIESRNEYVASTVNSGRQGYATNETALWFRLNYALNKNLRVGAGQDIDHNLFGANTSVEMRKVDFYDYDTFVRLTVPTLATLPGDIALTVEGRVYIPDSGNSVAAGRTSLRAYGILSKDIGRFSMNYMAIARPDINTKTNYTYVNPDGSTQVLNTLAFRMTQQFEATYKINDKFSVYQDLGVDDFIKNGSNINGVDSPGSEASYEILESAMNFTPNETYRLTAGVSTYEHDYRKGFTLYGPETRYFVSGAAAF